MNFFSINVPLIRETRIPYDDVWALSQRLISWPAERSEMVPVLRACYNRRSNHIFGEVELKIADEYRRL